MVSEEEQIIDIFSGTDLDSNEIKESVSLDEPIRPTEDKPISVDSETRRFQEPGKDVYFKDLSISDDSDAIHRRRQSVELELPGIHKYEDFVVKVGDDGKWAARFRRDNDWSDEIKGQNVVDLTKAIKDFGPMEDVSEFFKVLENDFSGEQNELKTGNKHIEDTLVNKWTAPGSIYN